MTLKTKFLATENTRWERDALHGLVDTLWRDNVLTRDAVYQMMSEITGKENVHIRDMYSDDMKKVVEKMQPIVAKHLKRICHCCKRGYKSTLGLYRCSLSGDFSLTYRGECNAFACDDV